MNKRLVGFFSIVLISAVGCSDTPSPAPPAQSWDEPRHYRFVVDSSCGERSFIGRFRIRVEDREVTAVRGLDESARASLDAMPRAADVPTLGDLLREADDARARDADVVDVEFHDADGHPTSIEVDGNEMAIDDEICYEITRYEPGVL